MEENKELLEVAKEIAKPAYSDLVHPIAEPTGKTLGLVPRAIKAALSPLEKWIMQKEFNIEAIRKLLEEKLKNTPEDLIDTPEPYVAVPALQKISYCMDNDELRNMYANLLATSMKRDTKNKAHPSFADAISQMSPDEAKVLKYFKLKSKVPTVSLRFIKASDSSGIDIYSNFSTIGELVKCDYPYDINKYFDNLVRLGMLEKSYYSELTMPGIYDPLINHEIIKELEKRLHMYKDLDSVKINKGFMSLTDYGKAFCDCCIDSPVGIISINTNS